MHYILLSLIFMHKFSFIFLFLLLSFKFHFINLSHHSWNIKKQRVLLIWNNRGELKFRKNCKDFFELSLQFLQLLTRRFKQLYERVCITTIRYIFPTIRIVGRTVQMYTDLKVACVVDVKLFFFMDWFCYNLIVLIN